MIYENYLKKEGWVNRNYTEREMKEIGKRLEKKIGFPFSVLQEEKDKVD